METKPSNTPSPAYPLLCLEPPAERAFRRARRLADGALLVLMVATAWLLGCQELFDGDVWWHVRSGQWIWEHGQVPTLDPFTFASADRPWIDLHWLFQLILAAAHAAGGARGMVLMAAGIGASVILVGLLARDRSWPSWVVAACWLPALGAMSARFVPRPELLSFLAMALYLAVLLRIDDRPALAWVLPALQVLWVNSHALFVLGPIMLGAYLIGRLLDSLSRRASARSGLPGTRGCWHLAGAAAAVALACMANPYGLRGTLFPLELFPKITAWGGPYKSLVVEFLDPREGIQMYGPAALGSLFTRLECALLWALPLSFLVPSTWRAWRTGGRSRGPSRACTILWIGVPVLAGCVILASALGLPAPGSPQAMVPLGRQAALAMAILGTVAAGLLLRSSRQAALLAAIGGLAEAAWVAWLRAHLLGPEPVPMNWIGSPDPQVLGWAAASLGSAAALLILHVGARNLAFRMILTAVFGYLALQAVRNLGLFGLAAGFVLAWNLGEWAAELARLASGPIIGHRSGLAARLILAAVVGVVIVTIVSGRFFAATFANRRLGLGELPLAYAHEAARFAGRPGLPDRALVFGVSQAAVYLFHNGPERKPFMDGRLEVASRATFETYDRLERLLAEDRPGWRELLRPMGEVVIMLEHERTFAAEATLLVSAEGRCVYYDAVASVFVSRRRRDLEESFPSVDFVARHFRDRAWRSVPPRPLGVGEGKALLYLVSTLHQRPGAPWWLRVALALLAGDRLRPVVAIDPSAVPDWVLLGNSFWSMVPDLAGTPPGPHESWDPARGLLPAQGSFCYRRAVELSPGDLSALSMLLQAYQAQKLNDAIEPLDSRLRRARAAEIGDTEVRSDTDLNHRHAQPGDEATPESDWDDREDLVRVVLALLARGRPEAAVKLFARAKGRGVAPTWATCDQVAVALLLLGRPAEARKIWEQAADPPSASLRLARIAAAELAALDFAAARGTYHASLKLDPTLGEAWFGLALLYTELGEAPETLAAAREGLRQSLTSAQTTFLRRAQAMASQTVPSSGH